jgi:hypothetical protein
LSKPRSSSNSWILSSTRCDCRSCSGCIVCTSHPRIPHPP